MSPSGEANQRYKPCLEHESHLSLTEGSLLDSAALACLTDCIILSKAAIGSHYVAHFSVFSFCRGKPALQAEGDNSLGTEACRMRLCLGLSS